MRQEAIHQLGRSQHLAHPQECICGYTYCLSCAWGCPYCGVGKDVERRGSVRTPTEGTITLKEEP